MEGRSFRQSLLFGSTVIVAVLLLLNLVFMAFHLRQSDIAAGQSILAQRILLYAGRDQCLERAKAQKSFPETVEKYRSCEWQMLDGLRLLTEGGIFAGEDMPGIENHEIIILLNSMISLWQARENTQPKTPSHSSLDLLFCQKAQSLSNALAFRAMAVGGRIWVAFWLMVVLVTFLLLAGLCLRRISYTKERGYRRDKYSLVLRNQLLMDLPEAIILLDKSLSLKFVNRFAERYFGRLSNFSLEPNFGYFCRDQSILEPLRGSLREVVSSSSGKVFAEPDDVLLQLGDGRKCSVIIQWYQLYLVEQNYLLGVIYNPEEDRRKELNVEIEQGQLRELSNNLFKAQDDERRHLADELHDGLCQSLAVLKMQVSGVERRIETAEVQEECRKARQFIAQIIEDVRRLSHDLSPVILDDLGLSDALVYLVNNFTALHNLKASVDVPDIDEYFSGDAARNIYRIAQEAVNNVGKHAKALLLVLEAEILGDAVRFSIKDDGVGFDVDIMRQNRVGAGLGLASMAERVRLLDGDFEVVSKPGEGCEVKFTLPKK